MGACAVDAQVRPVRSLAPAVNLGGDQFLAGAGLTENQNRGIGFRHCLDLPAQKLHRRALADESGGLVLLIGVELVEEGLVTTSEARGGTVVLIDEITDGVVGTGGVGLHDRIDQAEPPSGRSRTPRREQVTRRPLYIK